MLHPLTYNVSVVTRGLVPVGSSTGKWERILYFAIFNPSILCRNTLRNRYSNEVLRNFIRKRPSPYAAGVGIHSRILSEWMWPDEWICLSSWMNMNEWTAPRSGRRRPAAQPKKFWTPLLSSASESIFSVIFPTILSEWTMNEPFIHSFTQNSWTHSLNFEWMPTPDGICSSACWRAGSRYCTVRRDIDLTIFACWLITV